MMHIRLGPLTVVALSLLASGLAIDAPVSARQQKPATDAKTPPAPAQPSPEQQDLAALTQLVDAAVAGTQSPAGSIPLRWTSHHLIKSQGNSVYIPFTVSVDRSQLTTPSTAVYVRVVSKESSTLTLGAAKPTHPWDTLHFITVPPDGNISRAIALPPGTYDAFIAVKDKSAAAAPPAAPGAGGAPAAAPAPAASPMGLVRHELVVPAFVETELDTSSILLARALETLPAPLPADQQQDHPYTFGPLKVTPAVDGRFTNASDLQVLFWIYGASHTGGKPDVTVEFSFHQVLPEGEKYFNKTAPQDMNEKTLPPEFNLTAGHQLLSSLAIPLKSFPAGDYRLEVKITDKPSGKTLTENARFTIAAA